MGRQLRRLGTLVGGLLLAGALATTTLGSAPTWSGKWRIISRDSPGFRDGTTLVLGQKGAGVTGSFSWQFAAEHGFGSPPCFTGHGGTLTGMVKGRALTGSMVYPARERHTKATASLKATIAANGREIFGRGQILTGECDGGVFFNFRAVRAGAR